jgi:pyruvate,orthophosphate dikinase
MPLVSVNIDENESYRELMKLVDEVKILHVRANVETPEDARQALRFGATGIGLFRTEHMFYGENSEQPLFLLRKMIVSNSENER